MRMQNATLLAAVAVACCGAAHAEVVVYGTIMPFLESVETSGATVGVPANRPHQFPASASYTGVNDASRMRMSVGTTNLGFRGSEDLGGGLKAVFQLESGFQIDQNNGPGIGARNSFIGLQSGLGTLSLGQWDTPYKAISLPINPFRAGYVFDYTPIMGNPGMGVPATTTQFGRVGAKPDAAFDRRQGNVVQYWSPKVGGFTVRAQYSTNEGKTTGTPTAPSISPELWSASIQYDIGALSLRYGWEQHDDYFGMSQIGGSAGATNTNRSSRDRAHKLVALYKIGNTRIAGSVERLEYRNDDITAGAVREYRRNAYYVLVEQQFGASSVWGSYGRGEDGSCGRVGGAACSTTDLGADMWSLGYIYRFSKRTEVFAAYYRINNKQSGSYGGQPAVGAQIAPGADTEGFGVGMIHYF
jgi:predicted porin